MSTPKIRRGLLNETIDYVGKDPNRSVSPFNSGKHLIDGTDLTPLTGCGYSTLFGHDVRES